MFDEYLFLWVLEIFLMLKVILVVKFEYCCLYDFIRVFMIGKRLKINWIKLIICWVYLILMLKMKIFGVIFFFGK